MFTMTAENVAFLNTLSVPAAIVVAAVVLGFCYVFGCAIGGRRG